jgi:FtsZ-binding cell division protein ZapB
LESKIQQAVLASLPASSNQMEVDDMPDRVQALKQQVQTMIHKHAQLEASFTDHSTRQSAQIASVQTQNAKPRIGTARTHRIPTAEPAGNVCEPDVSDQDPAEATPR